MSGYAFTIDECPDSFVASGDFSLCLGRIVDLIAGTDLTVGLATANQGYGVLLNAPKNGDAASVVVSGITMVRVGAAVAAGDDITSAASGWGVKATAGTSARIIGRAFTAAASGMLSAVEIKQYYHVDSVGV